MTIEQVEESPLFSPLTSEYPQMCVVCPERVLKHEVMAKVHLDSNVSLHFGTPPSRCEEAAV